ncbi:MAG: hypothetical protein ACI9BW_004817 [Gammaproteobacteria bacterium]|jgi:hypothetical protein
MCKKQYAFILLFVLATQVSTPCFADSLANSANGAGLVSVGAFSVAGGALSVAIGVLVISVIVVSSLAGEHPHCHEPCETTLPIADEIVTLAPKTSGQAHE